MRYLKLEIRSILFIQSLFLWLCDCRVSVVNLPCVFIGSRTGCVWVGFRIIRDTGHGSCPFLFIVSLGHLCIITLDIFVSFVPSSSKTRNNKRKVWSFFRLSNKRFWQNPNANRLKQSPHPYRLCWIHKPIQVMVLPLSLHLLKLPDFLLRTVRKHFHQYVCYPRWRITVQI